MMQVSDTMEGIQRCNAGIFSPRLGGLRMPSKIIVPPNTCICRQVDCRITFGKCHCGCGQKTPIAYRTVTSWFMVKDWPLRYLQGHSLSRKHTLPEGMCICRRENCDIPYGTCHCGCGAVTPIATQSSSNRGLIVGKPTMYKEHHTRHTKRVVDRLILGRLIDPASGCWIWTKARDKDGYGLIKIHGVMCRVPPVSYETFVGPILDGLVTRHKCDNPPCFNPDHLETGTQQDNRRDAFERGRITSEMMKVWFKKRKPRQAPSLEV